MTYVIGVVISAVAFAIFTGMQVDRFYKVVSYRKEKVLDADKAVTHSIIGIVGSLAWPLVLLGAMIAAPLYGAFLLGKKLSNRKKTSA
jgi:hypothetical protein